MPARSDGLRKGRSRSREINDGEQIGTRHLDPGLVRLERAEALPVAGAGVGHAVVQERAQEPVDSHQRAGGAEAEFNAVPVADPRPVSSIIEKFRAKSGDGGLQLYSKLDVAVLAQAS